MQSKLKQLTLCVELNVFVVHLLFPFEFRLNGFGKLLYIVFLLQFTELLIVPLVTSKAMVRILMHKLKKKRGTALYTSLHLDSFPPI